MTILRNYQIALIRTTTAEPLPLMNADPTPSSKVEDEIDALTKLGERLVNGILQRESLEKIKSLLLDAAPLWYQNDSEGISALHAAAFTENEELVQLLIDEGAVWNAGEIFRSESFHETNIIILKSTIFKIPLVILHCR
jgi:ankyrin repeat protein